MDKRELIAFLKGRWGATAFFNLSFLSVLITYLVIRNNAACILLLEQPAVPFILLGGLVALFLTSYASYARIFKFKVFLLGHLVLAIGLFYFIFAYWVFPHPDAAYSPGFVSLIKEEMLLRLLVLVMTFNLLLVALSPEKLRYRMTRFIALLVMLMEPILIFVLLANASSAAAERSIFLSGLGYLGAVTLLNAGAVVLTLILSPHDNSFGGTLAGLAFINALLAYCIETNHLVAVEFIFLLLPFILLGAIVFYWFHCLHFRVSYDPLLQIYNRDYAHAIIGGTSRMNLGKPYTVVMVDIDHFKKVNDTYGHQMGDKVLHGTAQAIRQQAMPVGLTCRYGGEEIIIFFRNTSRDHAFVRCEEIRRNIRKIKYETENKPLSVSVSMGLCECDDPDVPVERVVAAADEAVYRAKETGRNKVVVGALQKRISDPLRKTYLAMRSLGLERRRPNR
ncbi:MAG: hypothetical protein A2293_07540 [Elusimicrobia bacterium RIFOXYB2_FULL_49_7]|nr:MAG: hypothetical protein A2293_07540 [Elusimicrobia bacterium RIFOXYB2_FULL_49_7]